MLRQACSRVLDVFSESCLREGMSFVKQEGMLSVRLSDGLLHARVKGTMGRLYDVYMDLKTWPKTSSRCLCDAHFNCEHAAASLLSLYLRDKPKQKAAFEIAHLEHWLQAYAQFEQKNALPLQTHDLFYVLAFQSDSFTVELAVARQLKKGGLGRREMLTRASQLKQTYQNEEDASILKSFIWQDEMAVTSRQSALLAKLLSSKRALEAESDLPWQLTATKKAQVVWDVLPDGTQRWQLQCKKEALHICQLDTYWYVDVQRFEVGPIELPYPAEAMQCLRAYQLLPPERVLDAIHALKQHTKEAPLPFQLEKSELVVTTPKPIVILDVMTTEAARFGTFTLAFEYAGARVLFGDGQGFVYKYHDNKMCRFARDQVFEREFFERCMQKFSTASASGGLSAESSDAGTFQEASYGQHALFHLEEKEKLEQVQHEFMPWVHEQQGQVELLNPLYAELIQENDVAWYSQMDWQDDFFAYELGIVIDGIRVNLVPILIQLLSKKQGINWETLPPDHVFYLDVSEKQVLSIAWARIQPFIEFLLFEKDAYRADTARLKIKKYQWVVMQEALHALHASLQRQWSDDALLQKLQHFVTPECFETTPVPLTFYAELRDYQQEGLDWLQALRECGFGGVLADEMGLGKTVQALAHLMVEKESGRMHEPVLIVAPLSLVRNWEAEATRFAPNLKVLVYHGAGRQAEAFPQYDLVISTYSLVQRDKTSFLKQHFYYLILDEAQWIKNARSQTTLMVQQIQASHRLCLSGTPFENHLGELWSLFHFIMPGLLFDKRRFKTYFQDPIEKQLDVKKKEALMRRVQPFLLRRTKAEVAQELPEKTLIVRSIQLVDEQRELYEWIRLSMEKRLRESIMQHGMVKSQMVFLDALLKLRQICCDPRLLTLPIALRAHGVSAKLDVLMELLDTLMEEGRHVLLFSQFTSMLALIENEVKARKYPYCMLTGQTKNRQDVVNEFQKGKVPLFLMSLKAGGVGLNLTKADTVIHYDPWWNPAVEDQATDRTHRLGQVNPVFVYRLVTTGTVEEAMMRMQAKKRALFEGLLSGEQFKGVKLTEDDLAQFFQPLG